MREEPPPREDPIADELAAARFLAQASAALAEVVDHEATLERIAALAVPRFADWFGVHVRDEEGRIRRIAVKHLDPVMERAVEEMYRRYPPAEGVPYGAPRVMATGEALYLPRFDAAIPAVQRDEAHGRMLRALGLASFICVPMRTHGQVTGALTFATAESGRTYGDLHLRAAEDLAARAAIAIENARLLGALREADRRKDEFLAVLAHELRNPLAPLANAVEILRSRPQLDAEGRWVQEILERQVKHMSRLVEDLLDVSRITRGKIELRPAALTLDAVVGAAVEASRPAIERGGHALALDLPAQPVPLHGDAVRLAQVLANLLDNAAKYTPPGGHIRVGAAREGGEAVIHVEDDGIGFAPAMRERMFDMFVQGEDRGRHAAGGLGIGLTLVRRLVELHGGRVEAASDGPGRGARFTVRLPASAAPPTEQDPARGSRLPTMPKTDSATPRRILVVDDNEDAADSLATLLEVTGYQVRVAYDGPEAITAADEFRPDAGLLDIGLPRLSGYDIARHIRSTRGDGVVLIAITGWGQEDDRRRAREAGFDHHFTKPADFEKLVGLVGSELAARPAAG